MLFLETEWDLDRKGDFARKVTFYLNSLDNCLIFSSPLRRHRAGQTCPRNGLWRGTTVKCLSEGAFGDESLSKIILIETEQTKLCDPQGVYVNTNCVPGSGTRRKTQIQSLAGCEESEWDTVSGSWLLGLGGSGFLGLDPLNSLSISHRWPVCRDGWTVGS